MKIKISTKSRLRVRRGLVKQTTQRKEAKNNEWLKWQRHQSAWRLASVVVSVLVKWNEHPLSFLILFVCKLFFYCCYFYYHDYCFIYQSAWSVVRNVAMCCSIQLFMLCVCAHSKKLRDARPKEEEGKKYQICSISGAFHYKHPSASLCIFRFVRQFRGKVFPLAMILQKKKWTKRMQISVNE